MIYPLSTREMGGGQENYRSKSEPSVEDGWESVNEWISQQTEFRILFHMFSRAFCALCMKTAHGIIVINVN